MRLYPIILQKKVDTGDVDKLSNPIYRLAAYSVDNAFGRKSIFTAEEIALDSHIVTQNIQKAVTTIKRSDLLTCEVLTINDETFTVADIKGEDDDRWRIVYLKSYGK